MNGRAVNTLEELAARLSVPRETAAIAVQTCGLKAFLKRFILEESGQSQILGKGADGKLLYAGEVWEALTNENIDGSKRRARKAKV